MNYDNVNDFLIIALIQHSCASDGTHSIGAHPCTGLKKCTGIRS